MGLREELLEKYNVTGRIGFTRPKDYNDAIAIINTICEVYEEEPTEPIVYNLSDITNKLKSFFAEDFN